MVPPSLVNRLLIGIARALDCSPLVAHILMMVVLTLGFGFMNGFGFFDRGDAAAIWFGVCALVVWVTWATKGSVKDAWLKAEPWRKQVGNDANPDR